MGEKHFFSRQYKSALLSFLGGPIRPMMLVLKYNMESKTAHAHMYICIHVLDTLLTKNDYIV